MISLVNRRVLHETEFDLNGFFGWIKAHHKFEILENCDEETILTYSLRTGSIAWKIQFFYGSHNDGIFYVIHPQTILHYNAMKIGSPIPVPPKHRPPPKRKKRKKYRATYFGDSGPWIQRYGSFCFYCGGPLDKDITREHLVPRSKGGTNHPANIRLSHAKCNNFVGDMDLEAKARLFPGPFEGVDMELLRYLQANNWQEPRDAPTRTLVRPSRDEVRDPQRDRPEDRGIERSVHEAEGQPEGEKSRMDNEQ